MASALTDMTDEMLARSASEGDRAAFDEIVRRYGRPLTEFAVSRAGTYEDAEDAVQETFLRVYRHMSSYDPQYSLKNWLFTITYRCLISLYRKNVPVRLRKEPLDSIDISSKQRESELDWLWDAAREMKPEMHSCLWLRYKQGMPIPEIAEVMNKTENTIRVMLHRARKRLIKILTAASVQSKNTQKRNIRIPSFERVQ
jgi:RNA polymerase sigma-70 factor (ECF subfamily)